MSNKLRGAVVAAVVLGSLCVGNTENIAYAQDTVKAKAKAKAAYRIGNIKYNLGEWDAAIASFKTAFEAYPDASFLYNIGQAYRKAGDCKHSVFFYERFLALKPESRNSKDVEAFIASENLLCKNRPEQPAIVVQPKTVEATPPKTKESEETKKESEETNTISEKPIVRSTTAEVSSTSDSSDVTQKKLMTEPMLSPRLVVAHLALGPTFLSMGNLNTRPQATMELGVGYPISFGGIQMDVGVMLNHTSLEWENRVNEKGTVRLIGLLFNSGLTFGVTRKIDLRAEAGVGMQIYTGLEVRGNIFLDDDNVSTGALNSIVTRAALGVEYRIISSVAVSLYPVVLSLAPTPDNFRKGIDNILAYRTLLAVRYSM